MKKYEVWFDNNGEYLMLGFVEGRSERTVMKELAKEGYVTELIDLCEVK